MKPTRFLTAMATTLAATGALAAPVTAAAPVDPSSSSQPAAPDSSVAPTEPTSSVVPSSDSTTSSTTTETPTTTTLAPTSSSTSTTSTSTSTTSTSTTTTTTSTVAPPPGAVIDDGAVGAGRESLPEESTTTTLPVEETTTTTTLPVALPPLNPVWLQTGARRSTVNGEPGAFAPEAGRTPIGERQAPVDDVDVVMATIRQLESANQYGIGPNKAGASGAYQYIRSTWGGYGGYTDAYLAPPTVQDERARADVEFFLNRFNGNVSMLPVMWYYPRAATDATWMDRVPNPAGGNRLTVREYQTKWMNIFQTNYDAFAASYTPPSEVGMASVVSSDLRVLDPLAGAEPGSVPVLLNDGTTDQVTMSLAARSAPPVMQPAPADGSYRSLVFPVLGPVTYSDGWGACRDGCDRAHVGTDIIGVQMQPLLAAVDGTINRLSPVATGISGVAISITGADGWRYNYFHVNNDTPGTDDGTALQAWEIAPGLEVGSTVRAGQIIGYMGNSGNAEASVTHLHFEIRDTAGVAQPNYASLKAAEAVQACSVGIGPWSTPSLGPDAAANAKAEAAAKAAADAAAAALEAANADPATATATAGQPAVPVTAPPATVPPATVPPTTAPVVLDEFGAPVPTTLPPQPGFPGATVAPAPEFVDPAITTTVVATTPPVVAPPAATDATTVVGEQHPVLARTIVTPLFGTGEWVIDTDGRVTATGDAALIVPGRDLPCADGPAVPFGTDAAGWNLDPNDSVLRGTTLDGLDLHGTVLDGVLPPEMTQLVPPVTGPLNPLDMLGLATKPADPPAPPYAAHAFRMPSTGETVLLIFPNF